MCGENSCSLLFEGLRDGSSPRVRGKPAGISCHKKWLRLIPACAGKTRRNSWPARHAWAHPRVCGENLETSESADETTGSSPRVRGKRASSDSPDGCQRLIPACAGKTSGFRVSVGPSRAHPRVCGENVSDVEVDSIYSGSSPRVRGKPRLLTGRGEEGGLIPACAGKTASFPATSDLTPAHPRVCGENVVIFLGFLSGGGSSPRVRGKHLD